MLPDFFSNKYLVLFVSLVFLIYVLSPQVTYAGGSSSLLGWIIRAVTIILLVVVVVLTYGAASPTLVGAEGMVLAGVSFADVVVAGLTGIGLSSLGIVESTIAIITGLSAISTLGTVAGLVGAGLCLSGTSNPFYTGCSGSESPSVYYIGSGTYNSRASAPQITSSTNSATCNSVQLCYSVKNAIDYAIYRNDSLITQSETCVPPDGSAYSFCYTDSPLSNGTSYDYKLVLYDTIGQSILFPATSVTTENSCH